MTTEKFQNKYRIPSARAQWWDYGQNGAYFITICTAHRECYFGDVVNGEMLLSEIGKIANNHWMEIPEHFPFVTLTEYVIMPNHVHGIIVINKQDDTNILGEIYNLGAISTVETPNLGVSTTKLGVSTIIPKKQGGTNDKWYAGTLGVIINQFKRICTIESRKIHADFAWQTRFHDHIIRNDAEYQRIENYIINNPSNWNEDKFFVE